MDFKDYYSLLGVDKRADDKEIKQAYRKLARQLHPDLHPDDQEAEEKFKEVNEAYEVLSDPDKRQKYDALGAQWKGYDQWQQAGGPNQPFDPSSFGFDFGVQGPGKVHYEYRNVGEGDLKDLFGGESAGSEFFATFFGPPEKGFGFASGRPRRGRDLSQPVDITLSEAFYGTTRLLTLLDKDASPSRIEAQIPPGVQKGSRVKLSGKGNPVSGGGPPGDLYLVINIKPEAAFRRQKDDLRVKVSVPLLIAILGGEVEFTNIDGKKLALTIPAETQNGKVFRLGKKGMPKLGNPKERGDLFAETQVVLPQDLTEEERKLFKQLAGTR